MWASTENAHSLLSSITLGTALWILAATIAIKYIIDKFRADPRFVTLAAKLPGPVAFPIVGNGDIGLCANTADITQTLAINEQKYGSIYRLWFGNHLVVVLSNLEDVKVVFGSSKMLSHPEFMKPAREFWGDGIFTCSLSTWKKNRKRLEIFFNRKATLLKYVPMLNNTIRMHLNIMEKHVNGPEFDLLDLFTTITLNLVTKMLFDVELSATEVDALNLGFCLQLAEDDWLAKVFKPWTRLKIFDYFIFKKRRDYYHARMAKFVEVLLKNVSEGGRVDAISSEKLSEFPFLEALLQNKEEQGLPQDYIKDEIITFLSGATHTTAITLSFCILALAIHPEIQDKVYDEVHQLFANDDREIDANDVEHRLPYMSEVLKETERRFIMVPAIFRNVDEDTAIGSYILPSGTAVMIPMRNIHWNPEYYPNPLAFNPENFSPEAVSKRSKLTFMPFSMGSRNCVGKALAELELKLTLAALLEKFSFHTTMKISDIHMTSGFVGTSVNGYKVNIKFRK